MAYEHERVTGTPAPESRYTYERRDSSAGTWIAGGLAVALVAGLAFYFASGDNTAVDTTPGTVETVPDAAPLAPAPAIDGTAPATPPAAIDGAAPMAPAADPVAPEAAPAEPAAPAPAAPADQP